MITANDWKTVKFGDLAGSNFFTDGDWVESKDQDPNGDVRLIQLADIGDGNYINKSARFLTSEKARQLKCTYLQAGDILIARMPDPLGRACIFPGESMPCVTVVDVCILRPDSKIVDTKWLKFAINSPTFRFQLNQFISGTTRQRISRKNLERIRIVLPPLDEQRRIAAILDKADALREKRRQAINKLETLLQSVFLDMFGDPMTNPRGLPTKHIDEIGMVTTGNTPSRANPDFFGTTIEWIKSDNLNTPFHVVTKATEHLSEAGKKVARVVPAGSTLVTCIAGTPDCIGNAGITDREVAFNQQINAITPSNETNPYFLYVQLLAGKQLVQRASTNSMKGMVSKSSFSKIRLLSPEKCLQDRFGSWFEQFLKLNQKHLNAGELSDNLFNSLQQRAFGGELLNHRDLQIIPGYQLNV